MDLSNKRVWITGASSGIGAAVARELAHRGCRVALSARRDNKLRDVAEDCEGNEHLVLPIDVTEQQKNKKVANELKKQWGGLDVALLNAGIYWKQGEQPIKPESFEKNFNINLIGMVYGINAVLPMLEKSPEGLLVGMSSSAAYSPLPRASSYGASKAAVKYMLEALRYDWQAKDVDVDISVICPGFVKSEMTEDNSFPMPFLLETEEAARIVATGIENRKREIHFPWQLTYTMKVLSKLPGWLYDLLLSQLNRVR